MFGYDYRNRFDINPIQTNILMTQIRAQKKLYVSNHPSKFINTHRENTSKRMFQQILCKPSLSPSAKQNNVDNSRYEYRGKQMVKRPLVLGEERSRSGKRKFADSCRKETKWQMDANQTGYRTGTKRLDHSPTHQNRTTINLKWN